MVSEKYKQNIIKRLTNDLSVGLTKTQWLFKTMSGVLGEAG